MSVRLGDFVNKVVLPETSSDSPALAFHSGALFLAWKGSGSDNLNVACSDFFTGGVPTFDSERKNVSGETSDSAPALAVHRNDLFIAWKGSGNDNLSVARIALRDIGFGNLEILGLTDIRILAETSSTSPAIASHNDRLFIAWKGSGNENLNVMFSDPGVNGFFTDRKLISSEATDAAPALATHRGKLFIGWKGAGNDALNVAEVFMTPDDPITIPQLLNKQILPAGDPNQLHLASSNHGPALLSYGAAPLLGGGGPESSLFIAWRDNFQDLTEKLGITSSNLGFDFGPPVHFDNETSDTAPALCSNSNPLVPGDMFIAWKGAGNDNLNVAQVDVTVS